MSVLKLVSLLFPFVRDMILGESSLKYAFKTNKLRVLLLFFLMFCFAWTAYSIPRIVEMAAEQVKLEHRYQDLVEKKPAIHVGHSAPAAQATPPPHAPASESLVEVPTPVPAPAPEPAVTAILPPGSPESGFKVRQRAWLSSLEEDPK